MRMKNLLFIMIFTLIIFAVGCSSNEESTSTKQDSSEQQQSESTTEV